MGPGQEGKKVIHISVILVLASRELTYLIYHAP